MKPDRKISAIDLLLKSTLIILVILLFTAIIFFFSNQTGNQSHSFSKAIASSMVTDWNNIFGLNLDEDSKNIVIRILDQPIRKLAHVIEYLLLGFGVYGIIFIIDKYKNRFLYLLFTFLLVILIACLDEYNQFYSSGRGSSIRDVFIDTIGGSLGIYLVIATHDLIAHIKNLFKSFTTRNHNE